ncbi:MAG: plasmid replication protein RepC [Sneathiellaceae bacterium]
MTHETARQPSGLRTISRMSIATEAAAERYTGTTEQRLARILAAFKRAAPHVGIAAHLRETIDLLWSWTQPQDWRDGARPIVWPSNACLCHELGITERQVRNRLRALERRGLIATVESPTGRRYGRRGADGQIVFAYGFDLSPLAARRAEFEAVAEAATAQREARAAFRRRLTIARKGVAQILEAATDAELPDAATWADIERRAGGVGTPETDAELQLAVATLEALQTEAASAFEAACAATEREREADAFPGDITGEGEISFRHIQLQPHHPSQSDTGSLKARDRQSGRSASGPGRDASRARQSSGTDQAERRPVSPQLLAFAVPELIAEGVSASKADWRDIVGAADRLRRGLGISQDAWGRACLVMGRERAAAAVAVIVSKRSDIRSPGGYLRGMVAKAERGELDLAASIYQARDRRQADPTERSDPPPRWQGRKPPVPPMS